MIPTSFTASSPPTAVVGGFLSPANNSPTIGSNTSTGSNSNGGATAQGSNAALLGIASLILEGRALAEDEYAVVKQADATSLASLSAMDCGRQSPKPSTSRAAATFHEHHGGSSSGGGAASNSGNGSGNSALGVGVGSFSSDIASYLRLKASNSPESSHSPSSLVRDYYSNSSSESAASSVESNHSRWTQKLSQLRQESPSAHHHHQLAAREQKIAVECLRSSEPEYVALAINTDQAHGERRGGGGDFEIIRRIALNRMNMYNSPSASATATSGSGAGGSGGGIGGGSSSNENFMCSLQSLASNTCLRVGTPIIANPITASTPKYSAYRVTPHNTPRFPTPQHTDISAGSTSSSCSGGGQSPRSTLCWYPSTTSVGTNNKDYLLRKSSTARIAIPTPQTTPTNSSSTSFNSTYNSATNNPLSNIYGRIECSATVTTKTAAASTTTPTTSRSSTVTTTTASANPTPQQGPHCDQFLRKMGLAKGDASDTEEHHCDMSYVNITCTRWRAYCAKMENILARGEPLCIEVYLGPVGHKILLEQWIITVNEKQPPPTMTLPSLCSAIRSQLYFSQISAWCDLIKKSDKTIYDTGRLIFTTPTTTSAAGDLATTTASNILSTSPSPTAMLMTSLPSSTSPNSSNSSNPSPAISAGGMGATGGTCTANKRKPPRLHIFYRIKVYDNTACFDSKPNIHNFPNVNISENCSVSVCLKSLPRITGGIPKISVESTAAATSAAAATTTTVAAATSRNLPRNNSFSMITMLTTTPKAASTPQSAAKKPIIAAPAAVLVAATTAATITTNANKPTTTTTILTMNCDNKNSKEHHQQQQQETAVFKAKPFNHGHLHAKLNDDDHDFEVDTKNNSTAKSATYDDSPNNGRGGLENSCDSSTAAAAAGDGDSSNSSFSTNYGNLSHREKQLLKYRKRMQKRDKKQQQRKTNEGNPNSQTHEPALRMEQGEDDADDDNEADDDDDDDELDVVPLQHNDDHVNNTTKGQRQQQQLPNSFTNSIPCTNRQQQQHQLAPQQQLQQQHVKMISTGTQTTINLNLKTCSACGFEKSLICLKCNPLKNYAAATDAGDYSFEKDDGMDAESTSSSSSKTTTVSSAASSPSSSTSLSACSLSSSDIISTPRNKAELLLQAIQRTPKTNKKLKKAKDLPHQHLKTAIKQTATIQIIATTTAAATTSLNNNNHHVRSMTSNNSLTASSSSSSNVNPMQSQGCQVCKRQKTQHNFQQPSSLEMSSLEDASSSTVAAITSSTNMDAHNHSNGIISNAAATEAKSEADGGIMSTIEDYVDATTLMIDVGNVAKETCNAKTSGDNLNDHEIMEEEYFVSSTKLTPNIERCSLNTKTYYSQLHQPANGTTTTTSTDAQRLCSTPPLLEQNLENTKCQGLVMAQFKTPTSSEQQMKSGLNRQLQQQPHKHTPKPSLLQIACNYNNSELPVKSQNANQVESNVIPSIHNPLLLRRNSPKVNLTPIFCNPSSMMCSSSPIPIGNGVSNGACSTSMMGSKSADIQVTEASPTFSFESPSGPPPSISVQKSNSAPTLPNSPSLSPRFIKATALYKRRSRHLSDRSDRSSLGSDEQFSDEDIDSGMYSPFATSPVKLRTRLSAVFGRKPLLGNLEESLLQRRLMPKIEVMGFKLLLGASGGFCPTQLTIPSAAYFYELKGETLSTPYLCEIRLPRKGYTVPRCGTVQATLLNPMGTVVRMFVIPYDMRDMPALHQTFIRQRILADSGSSSSSSSSIQTSNKAGANSDDIMQHNGNVLDFAGSGDSGGCGDSANNATINAKQQQQQRSPQSNNYNNNNNIGNTDNHLGHFISAENMKSLRYSIHLRFQTSRSGRLMLHTDIRLLISRRTDCDTAAAHAKGVLEAPNELITNTVMPTNPKYSARQDQTTSSKI